MRAFLLALALAALPGLAVAEPAASPRTTHAAWHDCLHEAYGVRAVLGSPLIAADAALRSCRGAESAYLDALSTSPMLDAEDVSRVRPALVLRARSWLMAGGARPASL